jgi:hypothetical protein
LNAAVLHQSRDSLRADANAFVAQVRVNSWSPVRLMTRGVKSDDIRMQSLVRNRSRTSRTATPLVETSRRNLQYRAQTTDAVLRSLLLDECVFHRGSFAKNAAAFFSISRSSRSDAFSRRSRRFSCSKVSDRKPARSSFSSSIRCFQFCKSDGLSPRSRATCVRLRSPTIVARTASDLNSVLNDRRCFSKTYLVSRLFANLREVSGKPGQAHLFCKIFTTVSYFWSWHCI